MESGLEALPGFKCWRTATNSLCEKILEIFTESGVVALQRSDIFERQVEMTCGQQPRISHNQLRCNSIG